MNRPPPPTSTSSPAPAAPPAPLLLVIAAFLSLYFFWGSTYLAIKLAIAPPDGLPPFFMAGIRNFIAGIILYALVRGRSGFARDTRPTPRHWRNAAIVGTLLLLGGNGLVTFAIQFVQSSIVALLIAMLPIWMALLERVWERDAPGGLPKRPVAAWFGIALGFVGVLMLFGPKVMHALNAAPVVDAGGGGVDVGGGTAPTIGRVWPLIGAVAVLLSSFCWANGSLISRRASRAGGLPASPFLSTAMQLICGGLALLIVSLCAGEFSSVQLASFTAAQPMLSLIYLITAGSLIGFTSYIWLLGVTTPSRVATYAYVNPVVAVWLGWWLGGEAITPLVLAAAAVIIAGVALIVTFNRAKDPPPQRRGGGGGNACRASSPANEGEASDVQTTVTSRERLPRASL